jgi:hypothetical protein
VTFALSASLLFSLANSEAHTTSPLYDHLPVGRLA